MARMGRKHVLVGGGGFFIISLAIFTLPLLFGTDYIAPPQALPASPDEGKGFVVTHVKTPDPLKALYMTACVAGTKGWREELKMLVEETELNAVVIDIKDATGRVSFPTDYQPATSGGCTVADMQAYIAALHDSGIYVIGRISVFQDPAYTALHPELAVKSKSTGGVWKDHKGLSFVDVGATPYWDFIVDLSKQAYEIGFDEINFDYVRYPSDGNMSDTYFSWTVGTTTKPEMLEKFFSYLHESLEDTGMVTSADLFGMTTTVTADMGIGQVLERALPYFDYISPMVYPSHYPRNWNGFANPAEYPYEVIKIAMTSAVAREQALNQALGLPTTTPSKMRPWLQDFNLGSTYDAEKVRAQIRATYDSGLSSWLLWDAGNTYTKEALLPAEGENFSALE